MSLLEQLAQIKNYVNETEKEIALLNSGRKVSSQRARKQLQSIKQSSQLLRKAIITHSKELPKKTRVVRVKPDPEKSNFVSATPEEIPTLTDAPSTLIEPASQSTLTDAPSTLSKPKKKRIAKSKTINH
jgi:hypothetical protein